MREHRQVLLALALTMLLSGCGKPNVETQTRAVRLNGRTIIGTLPSGPTDRAPLTALPSGVTYRWVQPATLFDGGQLAADSLENPAADEQARREMLRILHAYGWREAAASDVATYELAVGRYKRVVEYQERGPETRPQAVNPSTCQYGTVGERARCAEPRVQYSTQLRRDEETHLAFAIVRLRDGATAWWVARQPIDIQRWTLDLLARVEDPTAFSR